MKPIIFNVDRVFETFRDKGQIATFRTSYPEEPQFWVRRSRTGEKQFEAELVSLTRAASHKDLAKIWAGAPTGFESDVEWVEKIVEMHGEDFAGWILKLRRTDLDEGFDLQ